MERRKFLLGIGALAASGAAAIGTGAFDSGRLDGRAMRLNVAGSDQTAAVSIIEGSANGINVDYPGNDNKAQLTVLNVNVDATLNYDSAFTIVNRDYGGSEGNFEAYFKLDNSDRGQYVYKNGNPRDPVNSESRAAPVDIGTSEDFGIHIDTHDLSNTESQSYELTIFAVDQN
jgi:hypothetical protein